MILTPILSNSFELYTLTMLILASFVIPSHIKQKWAFFASSDLMVLNTWVKGGITIFSLFIIPLLTIFSKHVAIELMASLLGVGMGYVLSLVALKGNRYLNRREYQIKTSFFKINTSTFSLSCLLLIACFEEVLFRGCLTRVAFSYPAYSLYLLLFFSLIFALSHIVLGWFQVAEKFLLGSIALLSVLILKSIAVAIFLHMTFNFLAWHYQQKFTFSFFPVIK